MKSYELGILVGRFQTIHSGHEQMIRKAIELCNQVGILIGSSQESGTFKNPFSYELRRDMLTAIFGDEVSIYPLPDIGVGNNAAWGEYVLDNVTAAFGRLPDLLVSGKEARRISWFDSVEGTSIAELYIPKAIDISASEMREHFVNNDLESWKQYTNPLLWDQYDKLRDIILASKENLETDSI